MVVEHFTNVSRLTVIACAVCMLSTRVANAQTTDQLLELVRQQAAQIEALDGRLKSLEKQLASQGLAPSAVAHDNTSSVASQPPAPSPGGSTTIRWKGGPELTSDDRRASAKLRGRVLSDAWNVSSGVDDVDYPTGTEIRAARLGIEGRLAPVLTYRMEADFAGEQVVLKDAFLQYQGASPLTVTVGNFKPFFSMENLTGLPRVTFMERALPNVFAISESIGLGVATNGDNWSVGAGAFGETPGTSLESHEGYGGAARATYAPLLDKDRLIHLGISGYHKHLGADAGRNFRIRQRPESRIFSTRLVDTGTIDADSTAALGLEFAAIWGPFSLQGEYMRNRVDYTAQPAATFDGAYGFASWFVTGESRAYNATNGTIARLRPNRSLGDGGWGALELALRVSAIDLIDGAAQGGSADNVTLGINWYLTEYSRLMMNWVRFDVDGSAATQPFGSAVHEGDALGVRFQVDW